MGDMAKMLGVTTPFLSAVENGKKNVPKEWIEIITREYNLSEEESKELRNAAEESKTQYKIKMENAGQVQRNAAIQFARSFDDMDDETAIEILKLLKKEGEEI